MVRAAARIVVVAQQQQRVVHPEGASRAHNLVRLVLLATLALHFRRPAARLASPALGRVASSLPDSAAAAPAAAEVGRLIAVRGA